MKAFNAQVDDWSIYVERLQHYFIANDVTDAGKKRSILLTVCGTPTYKLLRSLVKDGNLDTTSYDDLVKLLKDHYNLKTSVIVRRFHFNTRTRTSGESIASYVAALRELALHCEYGDKLAEMLRYRLVYSVNHKGIQRKLLAEADLTYDRAYSLAQMVEASERDSKKLENLNLKGRIHPLLQLRSMNSITVVWACPRGPNQPEALGTLGDPLYPATVVEELIWLLSADIKMSFATPARREVISQECVSPNLNRVHRTEHNHRSRTSQRRVPTTWSSQHLKMWSIISSHFLTRALNLTVSTCF